MQWTEKQIQLRDVSTKIPNGSSIYIGSCAATAIHTLKEIVDSPALENIQIIQMIPGGELPHLSQNLDRFRTASFWSFTHGGYFQPKDTTALEGLEDYKPISLAAIPRLLVEGKLQVDVVVIQVSKIHKDHVSLGMGVDVTPDFIRHARIVIAEVNDFLPWTEGPSKIHISQIDWWIEHHEPLKTSSELWPGLFSRGTYEDCILENIGQNVAKHINNGDTVRFGVTPIVHAIFPFLKNHKELGLHTDIFTNGLYELKKAGVFTNEHKNINRGRSVVLQAHGNQELYEFIDRNPVIEFHPASYVCDPLVLGQIDNLVSVVGALKIDLTGQVATDSISHKFYGGVWSDSDSVRGAQYSRGGKPIIVIPSMSLSGRSNIVFALPPGTGVSITRADVEYVVSEYGTAFLYGKSIRERCLAMIEIAHPDFRTELLNQAKKHHYLSQSQPGKSFGSVYPIELECSHMTRKGRSVFVRPIKALDEDKLRDFFHKLSDHSVYLRYFRKLRSMPQRILQKTADVDYSKDMALVVFHDKSLSSEIVGIAQWVSPPEMILTDGIPELAFQVRDDWQGQGLGKYLFDRLMQIASDKVGLPKLKADVLADNKGMTKIFEQSGIPFVRRADFGTYTYLFDLQRSSKSKELPLE